MTMKIGVIADVHGNLEALEAVLSALQSESIDRLVCLGDLVGYGPDPEACIERIQAVTDLVAAGNHDWAAVGKTPIEWFNDPAKKVIEWTEARLSKEAKAYLTDLPTVFETEGIICVHASPDGSSDWPYLLTPFDVFTHWGDDRKPVVLYGHTHVPDGFARSNGRFKRHANAGLPDTEIRYSDFEAVFINPGSIGQPRDGSPEAAFGVIDGGRGVFRFMRTAYPVRKAQEKMRQYGLPVKLIERLAYGL
jgi:predicted phosphodiesterase